MSKPGKDLTSAESQAKQEQTLRELLTLAALESTRPSKDGMVALLLRSAGFKPSNGNDGSSDKK